MAFQRILLPDAELHLYPAICSAAQAEQWLDALQNELAWRQDRIRLYGREIPIPRLNAWYGDPGANYRYSGLSLTPNPWTPSLLDIKQQVEQITEQRFNSVLANLYRNGQDSMSWHSDDEPELGPQPLIASLSLGSTRRFMLKHKRDKNLETYKLDLAAGSLLVMLGNTQHFWKHQIPKTKRVIGARVNLTFRQVK